MAWLYLAQLHWFSAAARLGLCASVAERAARWNVEGIGWFARQHDSLPFEIGIWNRYG
jgi:hypothetical protein